MDSRKHKSFAVTVRPKDGLTDEQIFIYQKWVARRTKYSYTVTEKQHTERHLHSAIFFDEAQRIDNIKRSIISLFDLSQTEKHVAVCVRSMYNHDWVSYCKKEDDTVVIHSNLPEEHHLDAYFSVSTERAPKCTTKLSFYTKLERIWYQLVDTGTEINPRTCRDFLFDIMYSKRLIEPLRDDRTIVQVSRHLSRYLQKMDTSCIDINTCFEKDE